jgi:hypothetical protein
MNDKLGMVKGYNELGSLATQEGNARLATDMLSKSITLATEMDASPYLKEAYRMISKAYAQLNDLSNAFEYQNRYIEVNDKLFNESRTQSLAKMQTIYETGRKQKEIDALSREREELEAELDAKNRRNTILIAAMALLAALALGLFITLNKRKNA